MNEPDGSVPSPCVRNCCLNGEEVCLGCFRALDEIMAWSAAGTHERTVILQNAEKRRSEYDGANTDT